ncbi:hypothetical protein [Streptomyces prasinopilosus]|uniref:hypothetical protein n=1 Tax=Streptomyces prasinopilosus TaxID=67344 RepID=UPI001FD4AFC2|nr:hypothetical protein [Streptomyces prasinopilosus]
MITTDKGFWPCNGEMHFAGQAAAGASEAVVGRLDEDAAGRLLLKVPLFTAPAAC